MLAVPDSSGGDREVHPDWPRGAEHFSIVLAEVERLANDDRVCKVGFLAPDLAQRFVRPPAPCGPAGAKLGTVRGAGIALAAAGRSQRPGNELGQPGQIASTTYLMERIALLGEERKNRTITKVLAPELPIR